MNTKELKLRGYVSPEDFEGTDAEKIQKALNLAVSEDIRKVIIEKEYAPEKTVLLPAKIEVIFAAGSKINSAAKPAFANEVFAQPEKNSWSFENKRIYLKGEKGAEINGNFLFFHAGYVVMEGMKVNGNVSFEFVAELRMEYNEIASKDASAVTVMRGCNNFIVQYNKFSAAEKAFVIDASLERGDYIIGKDIDDHELIIRTNEFEAPLAFFLGASDEAGLFNIQIDHATCSGNGAVVGFADKPVEAKRFFNITVQDFTAKGTAIKTENEVKHCYFDC